MSRESILCLYVHALGPKKRGQYSVDFFFSVMVQVHEFCVSC
jgi:hypothetical protein